MPTRSTGSNRSAVRALVGLLSVALLGLVPVAFAGPAHAAAETRIVAESVKRATYGDEFAADGKVQYYNGSSWQAVTSGGLVLERQKAGSTSWTTVASDDSAGSFYFYPVKAVSNATYRLVYQGDSSFNATQVSWKVRVQRQIPVDVNRRLVMKGKVKPTWKRKPVMIQVKKGKRWVKYAQVKTNRRSRFSKKLYVTPGGAKTYFRAYVKGTTQFVATKSQVWWTQRLGRTVSPRASAE
jgi:hypothetical protein